MILHQYCSSVSVESGLPPKVVLPSYFIGQPSSPFPDTMILFLESQPRL
jgi:hypothetical protein